MPVLRLSAGIVILVMLGAAAPLPFMAFNASTVPITCTAVLAHFYTQQLGRAIPGHSIVAHLEADAATGTITLRNASGAAMPVEALWCGYESHDVSSRSDVALARRAGKVPRPIDLLCSDGPARLLCKSLP